MVWQCVFVSWLLTTFARSQKGSGVTAGEGVVVILASLLALRCTRFRMCLAKHVQVGNSRRSRKQSGTRRDAAGR